MSRTTPDAAGRLPAQPGLRSVGIFFGVILAIGTVAALLQADTPSAAAAPILWIAACFTVGSAFGFLFGIPKIVQSGERAADSRTADGKAAAPADGAGTGYRQQVNTNLTEISDWLTKIIVGLTLINLTDLPPHLLGIARTLAGGIDAGASASALAFASGLIACYSVLGFLFGYLATRLFLAPAFSHADQTALQQLRTHLESTQAQMASIESAQDLVQASVFARSPSPGGALQPSVPPPGSAAPGAPAPGAPGAAEPEGDGARTPLEHLVHLADAYLLITAVEWSERVRLKDEAANEMGSYVLTHGISKDAVAQRAEATHNEGLVLALAVVVNARPEQGDFARLLRVARRVARLHVRYKVLVAVGRLVKHGFVPASERPRALDLLAAYEEGADAMLQRMIAHTRSLIQTETPVSGS